MESCCLSNSPSCPSEIWRSCYFAKTQNLENEDQRWENINSIARLQMTRNNCNASPSTSSSSCSYTSCVNFSSESGESRNRSIADSLDTLKHSVTHQEPWNWQIPSTLLTGHFPHRTSQINIPLSPNIGYSSPHVWYPSSTNAVYNGGQGLHRYYPATASPLQSPDTFHHAHHLNRSSGHSNGYPSTHFHDPDRLFPCPCVNMSMSRPMNVRTPNSNTIGRGGATSFRHQRANLSNQFFQDSSSLSPSSFSNDNISSDHSTDHCFHPHSPYLPVCYPLDHYVSHGPNPPTLNGDNKNFSRFTSHHLPSTVRHRLNLPPSGRRNLCRTCGKTYARPSTLKTHLRTHSGEKPYVCTACSKSFAQTANLVAHTRTHSGEKPYRCSVCDRRFSQSSSATAHMRTHSGERPYECPKCGKTFADGSTMTKHMRIHSGEKPYQCKVCLIRFSQSGNLNRHTRVHCLTKASICSKSCEGPAVVVPAYAMLK